MNAYKKAIQSRRLKADKSSKAARSAKLYRPIPYPRQLKGEVKSLDIPAATYLLNTTAVFTPLNLIRAGTSYFNRVGRKIELKSLHVKGYINPLRTVAQADYVRVMIVYDAQNNGTVPNMSEILQDTDQAGTNSLDSRASANLNNRDRFRIIMDERIVLPSQTVTAGQITTPGWVDPVTKLNDIERFIKLKGLHTQYKADSSPAVTSDIATGALFLVTYGSLAAGTEGFNLNTSFRLRYRDQ